MKKLQRQQFNNWKDYLIWQDKRRYLISLVLVIIAVLLWVW